MASFCELCKRQPMGDPSSASWSKTLRGVGAGQQKPADWLQYACDSFDWLYREGADQPRMMSLGLHLRIIGRPGRIGYFEKFLRHVAAHDGVWIATRAEIAEHWRRTHPFTPTETAP